MTTFLDIYQPIVRLYNIQSHVQAKHDVEFPHADTLEQALANVKQLFQQHFRIDSGFLQTLTINVGHQVVMGSKPVDLAKSVEALLMLNFPDMMETFHIPVNLTIQRLTVEVSSEIQQNLMRHQLSRLYIYTGLQITLQLSPPQTSAEYTTWLQKYPQLAPFRRFTFQEVKNHMETIEGCWAFHPLKRKPCKIGALSCFQPSSKKCKNLTLTTSTEESCHRRCTQQCHPRFIYMEGDYIYMCVPANFWIALQDLAVLLLPLDMTSTPRPPPPNNGKMVVILVILMVMIMITFICF